jgi:hypothetical protein
VWSSGAGNFTLPVASSVGNNWFCMFRNNGSGILNIYPSGTDTIDGNASAQLQITESLVMVSNGTSGYNTFGYGQSVQFSFTQLAYDVTGAGATITLWYTIGQHRCNFSAHCPTLRSYQLNFWVLLTHV